MEASLNLINLARFLADEFAKFKLRCDLNLCSNFSDDAPNARPYRLTLLRRLARQRIRFRCFQAVALCA